MKTGRAGKIPKVAVGRKKYNEYEVVIEKRVYYKVTGTKSKKEVVDAVVKCETQRNRLYDYYSKYGKNMRLPRIKVKFQGETNIVLSVNTVGGGKGDNEQKRKKRGRRKKADSIL